MSTILALVGLTLAVAAILVWPLLRRRPPDEGGDSGLAVYRDQLAEIAREQAAGALAAAAAEAARLEVERRLLAAARDPDLPAGRINRALALPLVVLLIAASAGLYLQLGSPGTPDRPFGAAALARRAQLHQALADQRGDARRHPDDVAGWLRLGQAAAAADDQAGAAEAYDRARALAPHRADIAAAYGAALVGTGGGHVDGPARAAFEAALALDPREPRAHYFLALARAQGGDVKGAIDDWAALVRAAPPGAPYLGTVRVQIAQAARQLGIDPDSIDLGGGRMAPPLDPAAAARIAALPEAERTQAIAGMVESLATRLQQAPDDVPGWLRLANAYKQLGQAQHATDTLATLAQRQPDRVDVQVAYAELLYPPETAGQSPPPPAFLAIMRRILALDPANAEALWFVARDTAAADPAGAKVLFTRLLARLPPDNPARATVEQEVARLGG